MSWYSVTIYVHYLTADNRYVVLSNPLLEKLWSIFFIQLNVEVCSTIKNIDTLTTQTKHENEDEIINNKVVFFLMDVTLNQQRPYGEHLNIKI